MIRHKLSFALRLVDDFTGRKLVGKVTQFYADERPISVTYKEEGFYLFMEPIECPVTVRIEANDYFVKTVTIDQKKLDPSFPVAEVRLYHKPGGSFQYRCSLCGGQITPPNPGTPFLVYGISELDSGYMLKNAGSDESGYFLELMGYHKEKLTGRVFGLGSNDTLDVFVIQKQESTNIYRIDQPLMHTHRKGDKLRLVYRTYADGNGNYVLPVAEGSVDQVKVQAADTKAERS
ncbi:MAG: hypothetical protein IKC46_00670 [Lachnospiraceae bacterium]|nr:hypothetical protein [Lachnospiraceae bacterium]